MATNAWRPRPKFGRRSSSSGRASVRIRIGLSRDQSSRWSMKSRRPSSAHCSSSNTSTVGPRSATRSKNVRHALKSCSRCAQSAFSMPSRAPSAGSTRRRSSGSGTKSASVARELLSRRRRVLALRDARAPTNHLAQRPVGDALAVRRRAALMPVIDAVRGETVEILLELPNKPALAQTGLAGHRDDAQLAARARLRGAGRSAAGTPRRGPRTAARALPRGPAPPTRATTRSARHAATGSSLPFSSWSPTRS